MTILFRQLKLFNAERLKFQCNFKVKSVSSFFYRKINVFLQHRLSFWLRQNTFFREFFSMNENSTSFGIDLYKNYFNPVKIFLWGNSIWWQIKQSPLDLNRGLSSNFLWLRCANHMKFTEGCVMCMEKDVLKKRKADKWANHGCATTILSRKDSWWICSTLTFQVKKK